MRIYKSILLIILSLALSQASGQVIVQESLSMHSVILGSDVRYTVSLPDDYYTSSRRYPVVYLLHGLGDNEVSWIEYGRIKQASDKAVRAGEIEPMIFIMPQGYRSYYVNDYRGNFRYQDMFINELIPFIDSHYRTIADAAHRATLGYSMGGFGALILPLEHPDVISACVPLSISIRTDAQYMTEEASGWDEQWGRLFGGEGLTGESRITDYYREHSPFYILKNSEPGRFKDLKIFIANGDDEHTLCRSNEELHILLRDLNIKHEYRVLDGGHEFKFWRNELPDGLCFLDDAFNGRKYRGDHQSGQNKTTACNILPEEINDGGKRFSLCTPSEYAFTDRRYPVVFFRGDFSAREKEAVAGLISRMTDENSLPPMILVFTGKEDSSVRDLIPLLEEKYRVRSGYRFRALIGYGVTGSQALNISLDSLLFTSCTLLDTKPDVSSLENTLKVKDHQILGRTWYYIAYSECGKYYSENGNAHILLREGDIYHEYRVTGGNGGFAWFLSELPESMDLIQKKIHW